MKMTERKAKAESIVAVVGSHPSLIKRGMDGAPSVEGMTEGKQRQKQSLRCTQTDNSADEVFECRDPVGELFEFEKFLGGLSPCIRVLARAWMLA